MRRKVHHNREKIATSNFPPKHNKNFFKKTLFIRHPSLSLKTKGGLNHFGLNNLEECFRLQVACLRKLTFVDLVKGFPCFGFSLSRLAPLA
jgi:hypothetical protein